MGYSKSMQCNQNLMMFSTGIQIYSRMNLVSSRVRPLDRLEKSGIIEPVQFSEWAPPIVPVVKRDGAIRVCDDYKLTANQALKLDTYPLPKIDDIFANCLEARPSASSISPMLISSWPWIKNPNKSLYQHTQEAILISSSPIWHSFCTIDFPEDDGRCPKRHPTCQCVH